MTQIYGKDAQAEDTINNFAQTLAEFGLELEFSNIMNPTEGLYSVILSDKNNPSISTNGKGTSLIAAKASAYGEMAERFLNQSFFEDYYLGKDISEMPIVRYKDEIWLKYPDNYKNILKSAINEKRKYFYDDEEDLHEGLNWNQKPFNILFNEDLKESFNHLPVIPQTEKVTSNLDRGICAIKFKCETSNKEDLLLPVSYIEDTFLSNGLCAGNSEFEAKVQGLSEIFERYIRRVLYFGMKPYFLEKIHKKIKLGNQEYDLQTLLKANIGFPIIPKDYIDKNFSTCSSIIKNLNHNNFNVICYDLSFNGLFPVVGVLLLKQNEFKYKLSIGSHPKMKIALERSLTECFQGLNFNTLDLQDMPLDDMASSLLLDEGNISETLDNHELFNKSLTTHAKNLEYTDCLNSLYDEILANQLFKVESEDDSNENLDDENFDDNFDSNELEDKDYEFDQDEDFDDSEMFESEESPEEIKEAIHQGLNAISLDKEVVSDFDFYSNYMDGQGTLNTKIFTQKPIFEMVDWSCPNDNTQDQYQYLLDKIKDLGLDVYTYDSSYKCMKAYKIIVPFFSEICTDDLFSPAEKIMNYDEIKTFNKLGSLNNEEFLDYAITNFTVGEKLNTYIPFRYGLIKDETNPYSYTKITDMLKLAVIGNDNIDSLKSLINSITNVTNRPEGVERYIDTILIIRMLDFTDKKQKETILNLLKNIMGEKFVKECENYAINGAPYKFLPDFGENFENFTLQNNLVKIYKNLINKISMEN